MNLCQKSICRKYSKKLNNSVLPITLYLSEVCVLTLYYYIWPLGEYGFYYITSQYSKRWPTANRNLLLPKVEKFWKFYKKKTLSFRFTRCSAAHEKSHHICFLDNGKLQAHCIYFLDNGKLQVHCIGFWEANSTCILHNTCAAFIIHL